MAAPNANILSNGQIISVPTADLVPGDMVLLEAGKSADMRLTEINLLKLDEFSLTEESER